MLIFQTFIEICIRDHKSTMFIKNISSFPVYDGCLAATQNRLRDETTMDVI